MKPRAKEVQFTACCMGPDGVGRGVLHTCGCSYCLLYFARTIEGSQVREAQDVHPRFVSRRRRNLVAEERHVYRQTRTHRRRVLEAHRPFQAVEIPSVSREVRSFSPIMKCTT